MRPAFAGVGARATPPDIINIMRGIGRVLAKDGYLCQTGAAQGADQAFAEGALFSGGDLLLCLPWHSYEKQWIDGLVGNIQIDVYGAIVNRVEDVVALNSVHRLHPYADKLKQGPTKLHARNWNILQCIEFMICWTPGGLEVGGTGQAIRIAEEAGVKIHNLGNPSVLAHFIAKLTELGEL